MNNTKVSTAILDAYINGGYRQARSLVAQCGGKWKKGTIKMIKKAIVENMPLYVEKKEHKTLIKKEVVPMSNAIIGCDLDCWGPQRWDINGNKLELNAEDEFDAIYHDEDSDPEIISETFYENPLTLIDMKREDSFRYNGKRRICNAEARKLILAAYNKVKDLTTRVEERTKKGLPIGKLNNWIRDAKRHYEFLLELYTFEYRGLGDHDLDVYDTYGDLLEPVIDDYSEHEKCSYNEEISDVDEDTDSLTVPVSEFSKDSTEMSYDEIVFMYRASWRIGHSPAALRTLIKENLKEKWMSYSTLRYFAEFLREKLYVKKPKWDNIKRSYVTNEDGSMPITYYKSSETPAYRNVKRIWANLDTWIKSYDRPLITKIDWTIEFTDLVVKSEASTKYVGKKFWTISFKVDGVPHTIRKADGCANWMCSPNMDSELLTDALGWMKTSYKK